MTRITRYGREMRTTFIATMFIACLVIVIGIPFVSKQMFDNEVDITVFLFRVIILALLIQKTKSMLHWLMQDYSSAKNLQIIYIWTAMLR